MLKDSDIKTVSTSVNSHQANAPLEQINQVILNMCVAKDIDDRVFYYIYPRGETIEYIALEIRASYHCDIMAMPGQVVFFKDMIFNLASAVDLQVATDAKQCQVEIDNVRENSS